MNAKEVLRSVKRHFGNYDYPLFNCYMYAWECDFWALSTSKYSVEVEVKISRADFFKDFKKTSKHEMFAAHKQEHAIYYKQPYRQYGDRPIKEGAYSSLEYCKPANHLPNKFFYACPEGLIKVHEVPIYAGLLYIAGNDVRVVKPAPFLHKLNNDKTSILLDKYYHRGNNLISRLFQLKYELISHLSEEGKEIMNNFLKSIHFD